MSRLSYTVGTGKRRVELMDVFDLNPNKLKTYTNRFAIITTTSIYVIDSFAKVHEYYLTDRTLLTDDDDDDDDDLRVDERPTRRTTRAREAYDKAIPAQLSLMIHVELFGNIPSLVSDLSKESWMHPQTT